MSMNADREEIREISDKLNTLLYQEEMLWLQRSRILWLKEGDRNTKFFHNKAVWRARKNKIRELHDEDGEAQSDPVVMGNMVSEYFQKIFTKDDLLDAAPLVDLFECVVTEFDNNRLCRDFSDEEISNALFQIGPLKALGPDGFP